MQKTPYWSIVFVYVMMGTLITLGWNGAAAWAASEQQALHALSGKIVFQSDRDGDWEIYAMNVDGSNLVQLTQNLAADEYPVWSPDGTQIAFKSDRSGDVEVYVMNADGTEQRAVTNHPARDEDPAWSPDGDWLIFQSTRESNIELFFIRPDGTGLKRFTRTLGKNALAAWSPDGQHIAYTGNRYLGWDVYVTNLDKTRDERITTGDGACRPDWSPDGQKIAYVSGEDSKKTNIWIINPDGSDRWNLTRDTGNYNYYPAWSPDGNHLVYARSPEKEGANWELYVIATDGKQQPIQLTDHPDQDKFPDWHSGEISDELFQALTTFQEVVYESEEALRVIGSPRKDADASNGQAVYAPLSQASGFVMYGPYVTYQPGRYRAIFRLKAEAITQLKQPVVAIDVTTDKGKTLVARQEVPGTQLSTSQYQELQLEFALQEPKTLEFRVFSFGTADVWADSITIRSRG
jgi:TolB protein